MTTEAIYKALQLNDGDQYIHLTPTRARQIEAMLKAAEELAWAAGYLLTCTDHDWDGPHKELDVCLEAFENAGKTGDT